MFRILVINILTSCIALMSCQNNSNKILQESVRLNEDHFNNITINLTQNGKLKAIVYADSAIRRKTEYNSETLTEFFGNFKTQFFDKYGKKDMFAKAKYCKLNEQTNYMFMKDDVYIETIKGEIIKSKDLTWDNATERFRTDDSIDIRRPNERVRGIGFSGNSDLSSYQIFKSVGSTNSQSIEF